MSQSIGFARLAGIRVAHATHGDGPPLVLAAPFVGHLEQEWDQPEFRAFVEALAERRTVVRYDRPGTGLSERALPRAPGLELDVAVLGRLIEHLALGPAALFGASWGGTVALALAAREPDVVERVATFGTAARGSDAAPEQLRQAILSAVRAHWGAGSRILADIWLPGADAALRERFAALQRASADPATAATLLRTVYDTDVRDVLGDVRCPVLVLHRRGDRTMPYTSAHELAQAIPDARLVPLEGDQHPPWLGDRDAVLGALAPFLDTAPRGTVADSDLSARELEVLRLAADGLSDAAIADRLVVSPHTVHRHMANIRAKLRQPSRAAAAAYAARRGLI